MANSSLDKVIHDFNRRFAEPLPEFYKRRIVVWIDKDREFADKLDEITINGVKVVALTSGGCRNPFLCHDNSSDH